MRFSPIEIFQSARVCLNIYGQQNVYLCTIATELQWVKGFVTVSNPIWFLGARAHLGTRMWQSRYQGVLSRTSFQMIGGTLSGPGQSSMYFLTVPAFPTMRGVTSSIVEESTRVYDQDVADKELPLLRFTFPYRSYLGRPMLLLSQGSINLVSSKVCCKRNCVQPFSRLKIRQLREHMYRQTGFEFKNHLKLDVHRQIHVNAEGCRVVTLEGEDVCLAA
jgi:hypothetical protein